MGNFLSKDTEHAFMRTLRKLLVPFLAVIATAFICPARSAGEYCQMVHFMCDIAHGEVDAKFYLWHENLPTPDGDILFSDLAKHVRNLDCRLSPEYTVEARAMASDRTPSNDNVAILVNQKEEADLSILGPYADPLWNYTSSVELRQIPGGKLRLINVTARDID